MSICRLPANEQGAASLDLAPEVVASPAAHISLVVAGTDRGTAASGTFMLPGAAAGAVGAAAATAAGTLKLAGAGAAMAALAAFMAAATASRAEMMWVRSEGACSRVAFSRSNWRASSPSCAAVAAAAGGGEGQQGVSVQGG